MTISPDNRKQYDDSRPSVPADARRAVEVESGHACAVRLCREHTYLEIHHINQNREDNRVENLILLCDKHHKMAHAEVIDRKALHEYKKALKDAYRSELHNRVELLEKLVQEMSQLEDKVTEVALPSADPGTARKTVDPRPSVMTYTLEQLALRRFEEDRGLFVDRGAGYAKDGKRIELDGVRESDGPEGDSVIEVRWIRKRYLDGPGYITQLDAKVSIYEMMTGRKGHGILIVVVPKESLKSEVGLSLLREQATLSERKPEVVVYSYDDLGFDPGPVTAGLFTSAASSGL